MRIAIVALAHEADILRRALLVNPEHRVIWIATSGGEAIQRCAKATPDLILMGLSLDGMDGVEATRRIMASTPCAILAVAESIRSDARRVFEAMGHGALDAVDIPELDSRSPVRSAAILLTKVAAVSRLIGDKNGAGRAQTLRHQGSSDPVRHKGLVAIGASAGGPAALATVLGGLPKAFPAAIVVIQHIDEKIAPGMAEWLGQHTALPVRVAAEGDRPMAGTVLLAATSDHLTLITSERLGYTVDPRDYVYRPSVDVFFQSVSRLWLGEAVGVLLTGMGRDGALGLKALHDQGRHTIAQDEASSAVYGMPRAAVTLGAAVDVLPMDRIASRLVDVLVGKGR